MRRSRWNWAIGAVAPWCLGMALLVSITADAGQDATVGGTFVRLVSRAAPEPDDLVPAALVGAREAVSFASDKLLVPATFDLGRPDDFTDTADEVEPRRGAKRRVDGSAPVIDRTRKGDPALGLRPTFDSQFRRPGALRAAGMLAPEDDATPAASFSLQDDGGPLDGATAFSPWNEGENMQGDDGGPLDHVMSMRPAALKQRLAQGATPKVSRADALSSTTPAAPDGAPVAAIFSPRQLGTPEATIVPRASHPDYAALLTGESGGRERKCLAQAVYFESRSEPEDGQAAVAQVVLNRATSGLYPASICGVVFQNRTHFKACQFSFACEGKSLRITEPEAWRTAVRISDAVLAGRTYLSDVGGATHYHARYVRPGWSRRLVKMDVIGHHIFYKLRHGQT